MAMPNLNLTLPTDALQFYTDQGLLSDTTTSVFFTRRINKLFDILNARRHYDGLQLDTSNYKVKC